jgi:uncharacterized SAM-binding protein YcdF (DUF218 family)
VLADAIVKLGVPRSKLLIDDRSRNTRDQALNVKALLAGRRIDRFVLVTSPTHMSRSLAAFRAVGLSPIPSASRLRVDGGRTFWTLWPDRQSLEVSDAASYDAVAWLYYWSQGWLR